MSKFNYKIEEEGSLKKIILTGIIDEDVNFAHIEIVNTPEIRFELAGIKSINSCGIREWIKWLNTNKAAKIHFENCPKIIIDQINMVDGFLPKNATVESFFVPYYNDDNGTEKNILFRLGSEFSPGVVNAPKNVKDENGDPMEMDVIESKYFKFLKK